MTNILFFGDPHCGHVSGLTHPDWQEKSKYKYMQAELWDFYCNTLDKFGHLDIVVGNGDLIDGDQEKSGGRELLTPDRTEQCEIFLLATQEIIKRNPNVQFYFTYGTGYHTGKKDDFERIVNYNLKGKIKGRLFLKVEDVTFDIRHKINTSIIPHGRATPLIREGLWNALWAELGGQPRADVFIRSHAHYFLAVEQDEKTFIILPAMKSLGDAFGERECSGTVNIGMVKYTVDGNDHYWKKELLRYGNKIANKPIIYKGTDNGGTAKQNKSGRNSK